MRACVCVRVCTIIVLSGPSSSGLVSASFSQLHGKLVMVNAGSLLLQSQLPDALAQRVLDNMLGANYDTFPWFKYYALNIFAAVTNSNLVGTIQLRDRIAIKRFNRAEDLEAEFHEGAIADATRSDNAPQVFVHDGKEYVYSYLADRSWHLVADRSRSPVSYQFMREYNESLNSNASGDEDNFGLKILLAYYEYFNNFVGF